MTSINIHFRPSTSRNRKTGTLFIRVIHERKYKDIHRGYRIYPEEWEEKNRRLKVPGTDPTDRRFALTEIERKIQGDMARLKNVIRRLAMSGAFTVTDIVREFGISRDDGLLPFATRLSEELLKEGRFRTARAYRSAVKSFLQFYGEGDLPLSELKPRLIRNFERYLLDRGLQMNTVSFYMRNLRAIYYKAIAARIIDKGDQNPFQQVFTGVYETRRRALDQTDMSRLAGMAKKNKRSEQPDSKCLVLLYVRLSCTRDVFHRSGVFKKNPTLREIP